MTQRAKEGAVESQGSSVPFCTLLHSLKDDGMKILNRKMHDQRVGVLDGSVQFDAHGVADVTDEQGAALLQIPGYSDADVANVDGPVVSDVPPAETPAAVPPVVPPVETPADPATVEAEAAAVEAAAAKATKSAKKGKE